MKDVLDPYLKMSWAKKHVQALQSKIANFSLGSDAYTATYKTDVENQRYILHLNLTAVPDEICLIAGDAFYNMRASLDQLVWRLARKAGIPKNVQFPVIGTDNSAGRKRFRDQTIGVSVEACALIETFQPYHRGTAYKSHPLWRLHEMCNLDKHRRIPANGSSLLAILPNLTEADKLSGLITMDATDYGHIISVPLAFKDKLNFKPARSVTVNFGGDESDISEDIAGIIGIYNFIGMDLLPKFDRFFQ